MIFVSFVVALPSTASAQDAEPKVTATISSITRVESWSYFPPAPDPLELTPRPLAEPTYTFLGHRSDIGIRVDGPRFGLSGAFNYVRLENLPTNAIGPGALGNGAFYFAGVGVPYSYQLYVSEIALRVRSRDERTSASIGRMPYTSGGEVTSTQPALETLKRERLHSRLIGNAESSMYQRRFDGARVDLDRPAWRLTSSAFVATQGGFEESANLSMPKVQVGSMVFTRKSAAAREWQAFAHLYRDRRASAVVPDNRVVPDKPVDVTIAAIGASHARVASIRTGEVDTILWAAGEFGDWYGQPHRAASVVLEAGHRWTNAPLSPWLRAGYLFASGDRDPEDQRHGTFFQMLPSSRRYALSAVYAQMNLHDAFVQVLAEPGRVKTRLDLHRVALASGSDLWYHGSGAMASRGRFFGFSGRQTGGAASLGTVLEGTVEVTIKRYWSLRGYAGTMWGGSAVRRSFSDTRLSVWHVENIFHF